MIFSASTYGEYVLSIRFVLFCLVELSVSVSFRHLLCLPCARLVLLVLVYVLAIPTSDRASDSDLVLPSFSSGSP